MDFKSKNFSYATKQFGAFMDQIQEGERLYLRSLSTDRPAEQPADISKDFPSIAADFQLPPELELVTENMHSSPLRISGPVNMWLHYDVRGILGGYCAFLTRTRSWRMFTVRSRGLSDYSYFHLPMSNILDLSPAPRARNSMFSRGSILRV